MSVAVDPCKTKPAGVFIQALTETTSTPESMPLEATMAPASQCASGGMRSHP